VVLPTGYACALESPPRVVERAATQTRRWLEQGGMAKHRIPGALRPHQD